MKIAVVDITGRNAAQYNPSLCKALSELSKDNKVLLYSPTLYGQTEGYVWRRLLSIVPSSMISESGLVKRVLRAVETIINYLYLAACFFLVKPDIIHFQWLPFVEFSRFEKCFLALIKSASKGSKLLLTVHNVYPHNLNEERRKKYIKDFSHVCRYIDGYIVHLESTKEVFCDIFDISKDVVFVAYHGIYEAKGYVLQKIDSNSDKQKIILFGNQNKYKGADLLIEALKIMPKDYIDRTEVLIIGKTDMELYSKYVSQIAGLNTTWINRFVSEKELYEAIGDSDLILLPYRQITQSGVLLLALSYRKPILTSDLPSFRETLEGFSDDYFFEPDNVKALEKILERFLDGNIDMEKQVGLIEKLNKKYSWSETGKRTMTAYESIISKNF